MTKMKKTKEKQLITKDSTIAEVVGKYPETIPVLMRSGMHCIGCPMAMMETLEQGLSAHGMDVDKVIEELNKIAKKKK
jgi:hybrid cluster-associated redox disulfide protein